jgi:hypothetical protein
MLFIALEQAQVAAFPACDTLFLDGPKAQLHGFVAIALRRLDLRDVAGPRLDHRDRNDAAFLVKDLGHPNFLAQDAFHVYSSWDCRRATVSSSPLKFQMSKGHDDVDI